MANNKKSFLMHIDSLDILDDLTNEQAGELFNAIRSHQIGEEIELHGVVRIAFSPFKNQFKRDDEKYQTTCKRRAEAGSKGGKQKVANASKCKQTIPNVADNKTKTKNKTNNDSDNDLKDPMSCKPDVVEIINYMNSVIGTKYKTSTKSHIQNISARLSEGHSVDDLKKVIDFKYSQWGNSQEMAGFLRPSTLFQTSKFQGYLTASKTVNSGQHRDINKIGTDFSQPEGFKKMKFNELGEMIGYE